MLWLSVKCHAQEYRYEVGAAAALAGYLGDAGPKIPFVPPGFGLSIVSRYNINFRMAGYLALDYTLYRGNLRYAHSEFPQATEARFATSTFLLNPAFEYHFYPYSDKFSFRHTRRLVPYIALGFAAGVGLKAQGGLFFIPGLTGALGLKYKLANRWNITCSLGGKYFFTDKLEAGSKDAAWLDNPLAIAKAPFKGNDGGVALTIGLTYEFGKRTSGCNNL